MKKTEKVIRNLDYQLYYASDFVANTLTHPGLYLAWAEFLKEAENASLVTNSDLEGLYDTLGGE